MTIRYSIPAQLYRLRNDLIIDTHLRLFLIILWCFIRLKAYWKHKSQQTHTHTHKLCFFAISYFIFKSEPFT